MRRCSALRQRRIIKVKVLTLRLILDLVDPPDLIELSREGEENPACMGDAPKWVSNMNEDLGERKGIKGVTYPSLRCPPNVFGVARRETEAALRTWPSRLDAKRYGKWKDAERERSWSESKLRVL